ncbi:MAG: PDDEXK nuclease domain-containing protein [Fulvivirga sp.]
MSVETTDQGNKSKKCNLITLLIFAIMENLSDSNELVKSIRSIVKDARQRVARNVNIELIVTYWRIGKEIIENEQRRAIDSKSSRQLILILSKQLTYELGKGFSRANLFNMRKFFLEYPDVQTLSGHLTWSHFSELLILEDKQNRSFYENETTGSLWSVRELKRQIDSSLYERLVLSKGKANKEKLKSLAEKGQILTKPEDIVKDPYVFEFLGLPENKPVLEKDLERRLIRHIEDFLLELGKGFMFVGSQQRITINNTHYFVDMVFYNKILKSYILIELKTTKLKIGDAGQLNTYLNFYKTEVNDTGDNPPIGIIICAEKDDIGAEYFLGGFDNNLFASRFSYILPDKEELIKELENALNAE